MDFVDRPHFLVPETLLRGVPTAPAGARDTTARSNSSLAEAPWIGESFLLSLVVPFYNEEEMIPAFFSAVIPALEAIDGTQFEIVRVNDGSRDGTLRMLIGMSNENSRIRVVDLTRSFGKEAALSAGLDEARGAIVIPFDTDLQDPPGVMQLLVAKRREGYDVVVAKCVSRRTDSFLMRRAD
ncbi:glycosyltransferase [Paraburkholderia dinghuensis]|uniref:Glycosyltransferase n=1 Tax=Paraburkholderia dinghuensis TaxID=2305225 RepID=A0A3N6NUI4_9BURK|nr:glycosyltransferase [Paraburkholderia dinghuensis]